MPALRRTGELVRLEIPAQPAFVGVARSVVAAVAAALDVIDDDRLEDLRVAVSEACTNAVEAHRRDAIDKRVTISCRATADRLEICIEDSGNGFNMADVPIPQEADAPFSVTTERGWGIQLIQALVDDVTFRRTSEGTAVDLVIRFEATG